MTDNVPSDKTSSVNRRTVVTAAAWSVPLIATSVASPAVAASPSGPQVLGIAPVDSSTRTLQRCKAFAPGALAFQTLLNGVPAKVTAPNNDVMITLPAGLRFTGTGTTDTLVLRPEPTTGLVTLPGVQAVGAAGRYSITASFQGATAAISIDISTIGVADLYALPFGPATTKGPIALPNAVGAESSANSFAFFDSEGALYLSGDSYRIPFDKPERFFADELPKVVGLSLDTIHGSGSSYHNNLLVRTENNRVFFAYSITAKPTEVQEVGGLSGTVLSVHAFDGMHYVHTTEGVFYCGDALGGSSIGNFRLLPGSEGATRLAVWGENKSGRRTGAAFVNTSNQIVWFNAVDQRSTLVTLDSVPNGVRRMVAGNDSLMVLDMKGNLAVRGESWHGAKAQNSFVTIKQDVAEIAAWTRQYQGSNNGFITLGTDGSVSQGFSSTGGAYYAPVPVKNLDAVVTRLFAADGNYQALASDGSIWHWFGNNDWAPKGGMQVTPASRSDLPDGFAVSDFYSSGTHETGNDTYLGWGIALGQTTCTLL